MRGPRVSRVGVVVDLLTGPAPAGDADGIEVLTEAEFREMIE